MGLLHWNWSWSLSFAFLFMWRGVVSDLPTCPYDEYEDALEEDLVVLFGLYNRF